VGQGQTVSQYLHQPLPFGPVIAGTEAALTPISEFLPQPYAVRLPWGSPLDASFTPADPSAGPLWDVRWPQFPCSAASVGLPQGPGTQTRNFLPQPATAQVAGDPTGDARARFLDAVLPAANPPAGPLVDARWSQFSCTAAPCGTLQGHGTPTIDLQHQTASSAEEPLPDGFAAFLADMFPDVDSEDNSGVEAGSVAAVPEQATQLTGSQCDQGGMTGAPLAADVGPAAQEPPQWHVSHVSHGAPQPSVEQGLGRSEPSALVPVTSNEVR
jgi:hypothetical protein